MFKLLFYIFGILFAYHKNKNFKNISENVKKSIENHKNKTEPLKISINTNKLKEIPEEHKKVLKDSLIAFLFLVWMLIGLITFQWILFAGVLIFGILINWIIKNFFINNLTIRILLSKTHYLATWILCMLTPINAYYFHINSNQIIQFFTQYGR